MITKIDDEVIKRLNRNDVIVYKYTSSPEYIFRNDFEDEECCYSMGNEFLAYCWYNRNEIVEKLNHCLEDGTLSWINDED